GARSGFYADKFGGRRPTPVGLPGFDKHNAGRWSVPPHLIPRQNGRQFAPRNTIKTRAIPPPVAATASRSGRATRQANQCCRAMAWEGGWWEFRYTFNSSFISGAARRLLTAIVGGLPEPC